MKRIHFLVAIAAVLALLVAGAIAQDQPAQPSSAPAAQSQPATPPAAQEQPAAPAAAPAVQDQSAQPATPATPATPAAPAAPSAQEQSAQPASPAAQGASSDQDLMNRTSFTGCLTGTEDNYILKDEKSGELFRLHSDKDIGEHVNKEVTVIGRVQDQQREHQAQNEKASEQATGATIPQHGINVEDIKDAGGSCGQSQK